MPNFAVCITAATIQSSFTMFTHRILLCVCIKTRLLQVAPLLLRPLILQNHHNADSVRTAHQYGLETLLGSLVKLLLKRVFRNTFQNFVFVHPYLFSLKILQTLPWSSNDLASAGAFSQAEQIVWHITVRVGLQIFATIVFSYNQIGSPAIDVGIKGISTIKNPTDRGVFGQTPPACFIPDVLDSLVGIVMPTLLCNACNLVNSHTQYPSFKPSKSALAKNR
jgi:hypothetical protein